MGPLLSDDHPKYMSVHKIKGIEPIIYDNSVKDGVWLALEGYSDDQWFTSTSFRPVKETNVDISIFRKLLTPTKIKEDA